MDTIDEKLPKPSEQTISYAEDVLHSAKDLTARCNVSMDQALTALRIGSMLQFTDVIHDICHTDGMSKKTMNMTDAMLKLSADVHDAGYGASHAIERLADAAHRKADKK